jgi:hypothetical protein
VLRAHQIEAVSKCLSSNRIINLPTGTGKEKKKRPSSISLLALLVQKYKY